MLTKCHVVALLLSVGRRHAQIILSILWCEAFFIKPAIEVTVEIGGTLVRKARSTFNICTLLVIDFGSLLVNSLS